MILWYNKSLGLGIHLKLEYRRWHQIFSLPFHDFSKTETNSNINETPVGAITGYTPLHKCNCLAVWANLVTAIIGHLGLYDAIRAAELGEEV